MSPANCFQLDFNPLLGGIVSARPFDFPVGVYIKPKLHPGIVAKKQSRRGEVASSTELLGRQFDLLDGFQPEFREGRLWQTDVLNRGQILAFGKAESEDLHDQLVDKTAKFVLLIPKTLVASVAHCTVITKGEVRRHLSDGRVTSGGLVLIGPQTTIHMTPTGSRHQSDLIYDTGYRQSDLKRSAYEDIYQILVTSSGLRVCSNQEIRRDAKLVAEDARRREELAALIASEKGEVS